MISYEVEKANCIIIYSYKIICEIFAVYLVYFVVFIAVFADLVSAHEISPTTLRQDPGDKIWNISFPVI